MARGWVYKRCPHGVTGTPRRGGGPATPACRCRRGYWYWRAEGAPNAATHARIRPSKGGYETRTLAEEGLLKYLAETGGGRNIYDQRMTVGLWLPKWLADGEAAGRWEATTLARYKAHAALFATMPIARVRLRDLRRQHIEQLITELSVSARTGQRKLPSTLDQYRLTLQSALTSAVNGELIPKNPAAGRIDAIGTIGPRVARWWEPSDLRSFLTFVEDDELVSLWTVAAFTGLRRSELCGLRWEDVNLDIAPAGLSVAQRCVAVDGQRLCPCCEQTHSARLLRPAAKTPAGVRWVPLAAEAVSALRVQRAMIEAIVAQWGGEVFVNHDLVWPEMNGGPRSPGEVTKRHAELVRQAGLPKVTLHEMRHGAITLMANSGMPTALIAIVAGHGSDGITKAVYVHGLRGILAGHVQAGADLVIRSSDD